MVQSKAKIFLADERGVNETAWFRSFNTFNFGRYQNEHKTPFGNIYVLNDDTLDGNRSLKMLAEEESFVILLPIIGAIEYCSDEGAKNLLAAGQVQVLSVIKGETIELRNPFKTELVNFLQVWIRKNTQLPTPYASISTYDVNEFMNCLLQIFPSRIWETEFPFSVHIGKFLGRGETTFLPAKNKSAVFVFVLEGAFEVEGRLLHNRDGLALWDTEEIEVEALSNDAILLVIESSIIS